MEVETRIEYRPECNLCGISFYTLKELMCHLRDDHYLKRLDQEERTPKDPEELIDLDTRIILNVLQTYLWYTFYNKRIPFSQRTIDKTAEVLSEALNILGSVRFGVIFSDHSIEKPKFEELVPDEDGEVNMPFHISCREFEFSTGLEIKLIVHTGRYVWYKRKEKKTIEEIKESLVFTMDSIRSGLLELDGVSNVSVKENIRKVEASFIIEGGNDEEINDVIRYVSQKGIQIVWKRPKEFRR